MRNPEEFCGTLAVHPHKLHGPPRDLSSLNTFRRKPRLARGTEITVVALGSELAASSAHLASELSGTYPYQGVCTS